jgi:predicted peptidase
MHQSLRVTSVGIIVLFATAVLYAQQRETGFLNRTVTVGGAEYRYQVYVPREFDRRKLWPVILFLHGGGEYGSDGMRHTNVGIATALRRDPDRFPAIVVLPQAKADNTPGWQLEGGKAAMAALDNSIKEFRGDLNRIYLTGLSAGGNGSWYLASKYPERFAAALIICGFIFEFKGRSTPVHYPALAPKSEKDPYGYIASRVSRIPIWLFHGDADGSVTVEESRKMFVALKNVGTDVKYTELPGVGHNAWDPAYSRADVIDWMLKQRRH